VTGKGPCAVSVFLLHIRSNWAVNEANERARGSEEEITEEMIAAAEEVILSVVGSSADGAYFSVAALAKQVYQAMRSAHFSGQ
jgi:hypothetical protein